MVAGICGREFITCRPVRVLGRRLSVLEEDCDAQIVLRELMDRGLYTAPVNEYFGPGEYSKCIDDTIRVCHPDYWRAHEAGLTQPTQQTKIRERDR